MVTSEQARIAQSNNIIAVGVTVDEYMEHYAGDWCEYVDGQVIKLYPNGATWMDNNFIFCIHTFLSAYCGLRPVGQVFRAPFVIALPAFPQRRREPDLMVRLHTSAAILHPTYLEGAADICIEVVSPESVTRDYADKLVEYEQGGVGEYWVLDRQRRISHFYVRDVISGGFITQPLTPNGDYASPTLPGLVLPVSVLWRDPLPDPVEIADAVRAMLQA